MKNNENSHDYGMNLINKMENVRLVEILNRDWLPILLFKKTRKSSTVDKSWTTFIYLKLECSRISW